jgi:hypothetical protein
LAENEKAFSFSFLACKNEKIVFRTFGRSHADGKKTKNGRFSFFVRPHAKRPEHLPTASHALYRKEKIQGNPLSLY